MTLENPRFKAGIFRGYLYQLSVAASASFFACAIFVDNIYSR